jgi:hypothetical protein
VLSVETTTPAEDPQSTEKLRIDFLFLDLTTCTRCRGTDRNLDAALTVVRDLLQAVGAEVEVNKVHVRSQEQARALRFVSSPTIRVNGEDIALELKESSCGSEACTDGCGDQIACRVCVHQDHEYPEPPVAMIVDAILRHLYGTAAAPTASKPQRYELPENLRRFFAGKAQPPETVESIETGCCPVCEQQSCCDASTKQDCCRSSTEQSCDCR